MAFDMVKALCMELCCVPYVVVVSIPYLHLFPFFMYLFIGTNAKVYGIEHRFANIPL